MGRKIDGISSKEKLNILQKLPSTKKKTGSLNVRNVGIWKEENYQCFSEKENKLMRFIQCSVLC
jgi:hypothetical protein